MRDVMSMMDVMSVRDVKNMRDVMSVRDVKNMMDVMSVRDVMILKDVMITWKKVTTEYYTSHNNDNNKHNITYFHVFSTLWVN